jgi:hypothetical protein
MGKRSAVVELFLRDMGSMQRELRPSVQREDQPTMETKLQQIAVKAVNQLPKSVVREIRTPRSVGVGGGRPPPATRGRLATAVPTVTVAQPLKRPRKCCRRPFSSRCLKRIMRMLTSRFRAAKSAVRPCDNSSIILAR